MSKFVDDVKNYLTEHSEIKAVSFDIFNTVLLRYVHKPEDIYEAAGKRMKLPTGITPEDYRYIRMQTQKKLQTKKEKAVGTAEVSLEEIVAGLPDWIDPEADIEAEIGAEKELDFCNPELAELITWLEEKAYRIIYVSDMYFSAEQIGSILQEAKVPLYPIFVSNEFEVDKKSGRLLEEALHSIRHDSSQIIHIGDNFEADVLGAEKCGIKAFWYRSPYADAASSLAMEEFVLGSGWTDKSILRHVAGAFLETEDEDQNKWAAIGAQIIGPMTAYFMEWLSEQILQKKIDQILFLMREGSFFQKAWQIYSGHCGIEIENKLVFLSRRALLLPMMERFGEEEFEEVLESPKISLAEVFAVLGISKWKESFSPYLEVLRKDFESTYMGDISLYQAIKEFLLSEECRIPIEDNIRKEKERAQAYFQSLHLKGRVATVDIGYQGTIQKRLEKVTAVDSAIHWDHFLLLSNGIRRLEELERSNILGALGTYCGEGSSLMSVVNRNNRSLELLFLEGCGSTIGYTWEQDRVVPVLEELSWPERQKQQIEICQQGALTYLQFYLESGRKGRWSREEILQILHRLLKSPDYTEAELLGNLVFDENNGTGYSRSVLEEENVKRIREDGIEKWQQDADYTEVQWLEGLIAIGHPAYILQQGKNIGDYYEAYALNLTNSLLARKEKNIYVVAAGLVGRLVARFARIANIHIKAFVDNNPNLQGRYVDQIPVISFADCKQDGCYVIASVPYKDELKKQLLECMGDHVSVID